MNGVTKRLSEGEQFCIEGIPVFKPFPKPWGDPQHEDAEQMYLLEWAERRKASCPALGRLYHVPNGGKRGKAEAGRFKAMGVRSGVPDICLPVPAGGYCGLYIELKAGRNTASREQKDWLKFLTNVGYYACICYGWVMAAEIIEMYINGEIVLSRKERTEP